MQVNTRSIYKRLWQGAVWEQGRACYTRSRFSGRVSPALLGAVAGCWVSRLITVLAGLLLLRPHICQQERWLSGDVAVKMKLGLSKSANILVLSPRWFLDVVVRWWEVGWGAIYPWQEVMWYDESPPNCNQNTGRWSREMLVMSDDDDQPHYTLVTSLPSSTSRGLYCLVGADNWKQTLHGMWCYY